MAKAKRAKPVPLTKEQLQSDAGQELLELASTITEDGLVSAAEVTRLHRWLHKHASEKLPAVAFLNDEVDQLRADEKEGGTWPRRRLHRALERVLPKALREEAEGRRKEAESLAFDWGNRPVPARPPPVMRPEVPTLALPAGASNETTGSVVTRVELTAEVVARSRYRGEMFWYEERVWAVFKDPKDAGTRYAQVVAPD